MSGVHTLSVGARVIHEIDYSDLKEREMIALVDKLEASILSAKQPARILSIFNERSFATPGFMRHVEKVTARDIHLIEKMAFVGTNSLAQRAILKGYNFFFGRNFMVFDTREEAIKYLVDDATTDKVAPEFL